jgi:hypothetical protein
LDRGGLVERILIVVTGAAVILAIGNALLPMVDNMYRDQVVFELVVLAIGLGVSASVACAGRLLVHRLVAVGLGLMCVVGLCDAISRLPRGGKAHSVVRPT